MAELGPSGTAPQQPSDALAGGLRRLVADGTLTPEQAAHVDATLRAAGVGAPVAAAERQGSPRVMVEIAGYAGGALLLAGAATIVWYLWGEFTRAGRIGLSTIVAVALVGAAVAVGLTGRRPAGIGTALFVPDPDAARTRLASTLGTLGTGAAMLAAGAVTGETGTLLVISLVGLLVAAPLFVLVRGTPLVFATWLAGLLTVYGVADRLTVAPDALWWAGDATDLWAWGVLPTCYGAMWLVLGVLPRLPVGFARHQNAAGLLGGLACLFGSAYAAVDNGAVGLVLGILVVVACFAGFAWRRLWGFAAAGVLCALVVPTTALQTLFHDPLATAVGLLVVGALLLGVGLVALVRRRDRHPPAPENQEQAES